MQAQDQQPHSTVREEARGVSQQAKGSWREPSLLVSPHHLRTAGLPFSAPKSCFLSWMSLEFRDGLISLECQVKDPPLSFQQQPHFPGEPIPMTCSAQEQLGPRPQPISTLLSLHSSDWFQKRRVTQDSRPTPPHPTASHPALS